MLQKVEAGEVGASGVIGSHSIAAGIACSRWPFPSQRSGSATRGRGADLRSRRSGPEADRRPRTWSHADHPPMCGLPELETTAAPNGGYTRLLLGDAVTFCCRARLVLLFLAPADGTAVLSAGQASRGVVPFWQAGRSGAGFAWGHVPCHPRDCVRRRRITAAQGAGATVCRHRTARRP